MSVVVLWVVMLGAAASIDLSGRWEIQSMGADRQVEIHQKGARVVAHRVLWPELNGEKYKLEHLYRGTLEGEALAGELLVKEDELPEFEVLRSFTGKLGADGVLVLDGMPLKRVAGASGDVPKAAPAKPGVRATEAPALSQATPGPGAPDSTGAVAPALPSSPREVAAVAHAPPPIPPTPPAPPSQPSQSSPPAPEEPDAGTLFANILGSPGGESLLRVSNRIVVPDRAQELTEQGDTLLAAGKPRAALRAYEQAEREGQSGAALWHRMGRCYLALKAWKKAEKLLGRALRVDPGNEALAREHLRAKRRGG